MKILASQMGRPRCDRFSRMAAFSSVGRCDVGCYYDRIKVNSKLSIMLDLIRSGGLVSVLAAFTAPSSFEGIVGRI